MLGELLEDNIQSVLNPETASSLKRKLSEDESQQRRERDERRKEHKRSRDKSGERRRDRDRHRDRDSHRDRDRDRDRDRERKEKKQSVSVGLQCQLGPEPRTEDESRLIFEGCQPEPPSSRRFCGYSMANPLKSLSGLRDYQFAHLLYLEVYPNGGGKVLHAWQEDLDNLSEKG